MQNGDGMKLLTEKKALFIVPLIELVILACLFLAVRGFTPAAVDTGFSGWQGIVPYHDGFCGSEEELAGKGSILTVSTPVPLKRGAYYMEVSYLTDMEQRVDLATSVKNGRYLVGKGFKLSNLIYKTGYHFELTEDDTLTVSVSYGGEGAMSVYDVTVVTDNAPLKRLLFLVFALSVLLDLIWLFRKLLYRERMTVAALLFIAVFATVPYMINGLVWGHDIYFHLMRFDAIAKELRRGVFPVRMADEWMYGYSYPASIMYGDFLLYFPAVLRLFGFGVNTCFKCYVLFINMLTAVTSFSLFYTVFRRRREALLLTLVYVTASARLSAVFVRAAVGEYSAMAFFPLIALGLWRIYTADQEDRKAFDLTAVLCTGLGMTGVVCTHVLSTQMLLVVLPVLFLLLWNRSFRPRTLLHLSAAAVLCVLASMTFWLPFLDYYLHVDMAVKTDASRQMLIGIQDAGLWPGELFSFFQSPFGWNDRTDVDGRFLLTPGPVLMAAPALALLMWIRRGRKTDGRLKFLFVYSLFVLWMSTDIFPWNALIARTPIGMFLAQVQFPYRYADIALLPLTLLLGVLLENLPEKLPRTGLSKAAMYVLTGALCFVMTGSFVSGLYKGMKEISYHDSMEMKGLGAIDGGEYLLAGTDEECLNPNYRTDQVEDFAIVNRDGSRHTVHARTVTEGAWVEFPVFAYPYFAVVDEAGTRYPVSEGEGRMLHVTLPAGFEGDLTTRFLEPASWRIAEIISLLTLLACVAAVVLRGRSGGLKTAQGSGADGSDTGTETD